MKKKLIVIGASGHGKVVADIAIKMNKWRSISFLDDGPIKSSLGLEVIGKSEDAVNYKEEAEFFVAIGNNAIREKILEKLIAEEMKVVSLIHPSTVIGLDVELGVGSVIMGGVIINSSSKIGKGCIINTKSSIDHDNVIADYVHISPGVSLAGTVTIGKRNWIGIGSVVVNNVTICENCKVGAGSVVIKNITESGTYVGVPIRRVYK